MPKPANSFSSPTQVIWLVKRQVITARLCTRGGAVRRTRSAACARAHAQRGRGERIEHDQVRLVRPRSRGGRGTDAPRPPSPRASGSEKTEGLRLQGGPQVNARAEHVGDDGRLLTPRTLMKRAFSPRAETAWSDRTRQGRLAGTRGAPLTRTAGAAPVAAPQQPRRSAWGAAGDQCAQAAAAPMATAEMGSMMDRPSSAMT